MLRVKVTTTTTRSGASGEEGPRVPQFGESVRRVGTTWQTIQRQPSWIVRATAIVFFLVLLLPVMLLLFLAIGAAVALFFILAAVNRIAGLFRPRETIEDGRENVRIIRRD